MTDIEAKLNAIRERADSELAYAIEMLDAELSDEELVLYLQGNPMTLEELTEAIGRQCMVCDRPTPKLYESRYRKGVMQCSHCGYGENMESPGGPYGN